MPIPVRNTDTILADIRMRAQIPTTGGNFTDAKLLDIVNRDLQGHLMSLVFNYHEDYYLSELEISLVVDQYKYRVPSLAFVTKVRNVEIEKSDGARRLLPRIELPDAHAYGSGGTSPSGYYMEGSTVKLVPNNGAWNTSEKIIMTLIKRPNILTASNRTAIISSFTATTITLEAAFGDGTIDATDNFDVVSGISGHETVRWDLNADSLNATTVIFPASTFSTSDKLIEAGDFLNVTGESSVAQVPYEFNDLLVERAAMRVFQILGDAVGIAASERSIGEQTESIDRLMHNREPGRPSKITNLYGILRSGKRPGRRVFA